MDQWNISVASAALAVVALSGYIVGRLKKAPTETVPSHPELKRARMIIRDLESIGEGIRKDLTLHHSTLQRFKELIESMSREATPANWMPLSAEAERLLKPTQELAAQVARAYEGIRQQTAQLTTFAAVQTDTLTGVNSKQVFDDALDEMLELREEQGTVFSLAVFDIDHFQQLNENHGRLHGDRVLQRLAWLLDHNLRETDLVGRLSDEVFAVLLPGTDLLAASIFCERIRKAIPEMIHVTASVGVTTVLKGDDAAAILARAQAALTGAKAGGRNVVYEHDGQKVRQCSPNKPADEVGLPPLAEIVA
ncbi:MAG: GGDEF domain-containing protein [Planctomycetaceae bacterium]|nr:GGDEF domain-containing protein [Planctomycetaceae bacterium]